MFNRITVKPSTNKVLTENLPLLLSNQLLSKDASDYFSRYENLEAKDFVIECGRYLSEKLNSGKSIVEDVKKLIRFMVSDNSVSTPLNKLTELTVGEDFDCSDICSNIISAIDTLDDRLVPLVSILVSLPPMYSIVRPFTDKQITGVPSEWVNMINNVVPLVIKEKVDEDNFKYYLDPMAIFIGAIFASVSVHDRHLGSLVSHSLNNLNMHISNSILSSVTSNTVEKNKFSRAEQTFLYLLYTLPDEAVTMLHDNILAHPVDVTNYYRTLESDVIIAYLDMENAFKHLSNMLRLTQKNIIYGPRLAILPNYGIKHYDILSLSDPMKGLKGIQIFQDSFTTAISSVSVPFINGKHCGNRKVYKHSSEEYSFFTDAAALKEYSDISPRKFNIGGQQYSLISINSPKQKMNEGSHEGCGRLASKAFGTYSSVIRLGGYFESILFAASVEAVEAKSSLGSGLNLLWSEGKYNPLEKYLVIRTLVETSGRSDKDIDGDILVKEMEQRLVRCIHSGNTETFKEEYLKLSLMHLRELIEAISSDCRDYNSNLVALRRVIKEYKSIIINDDLSAIETKFYSSTKHYAELKDSIERNKGANFVTIKDYFANPLKYSSVNCVTGDLLRNSDNVFYNNANISRINTLFRDLEQI